MRLNFRNWAVAICLAVLAALGALYVTLPPTSLHSADATQIVGRDLRGQQSPNPMSADDIGYQIPRDKIKAIDAPMFVRADEAGYVPDRMPVIGVAEGHEVKAYPVPVLSRVEIVNDQIAGQAIAVTW